MSAFSFAVNGVLADPLSNARKFSGDFAEDGDFNLFRVVDCESAVMGRLAEEGGVLNVVDRCRTVDALLFLFGFLASKYRSS